MSAGAVRLRRLFFALWPDAQTRTALRRSTRAAVRHCGGKPVPVENLHLTLAFLGNIPDERVADIVAAARPLAPPHLTLLLERFGWFEAVRVLWVGPAVVPAELPRLVADLWGALGATGLRPELRPFHPHVTLARKVAARPALPAPRPVAWPVTGFALVESDTAAEGSRYQVIAHFPEPAVAE